MPPPGRASALFLALLLSLAAEQRRSFVQTAPTSHEPSGSGEAPKDFDEVRQLEELKNSLGKTYSLLKTHTAAFSNVNGKSEVHPETREEVPRAGPLAEAAGVASPATPATPPTPATPVLTELEIPERPPLATDNGQRRAAAAHPNNVAKYLPYSGVQYSPLDLAEYVFWTGDERGVTLTIEEFLQEGLMTREEAIRFLQEIKYNLEFLQTHYAEQRLHKQEQIQAKERAALIQKALGFDKPRAESTMNAEITHNGLFSKKSMSGIQATPKDIPMMNTNILQQQNFGLSDEDYEELLDRLRVADFLYTEYSLEEVIYQLAKVMFAQSLNRGNADAQDALQKFTNFLESEADQGHISRNLEKKVLDVLIASLSDTLSEHPHILNTAREGLGSSGGNKLLHQLLLLNPAAVVGDGTSAGGTGNGQYFPSGNDNHQSTLSKAHKMVEANGGSTNKSNKST